MTCLVQILQVSNHYQLLQPQYINPLLNKKQHMQYPVRDIENQIEQFKELEHVQQLKKTDFAAYEYEVATAREHYEFLKRLRVAINKDCEDNVEPFIKEYLDASKTWDGVPPHKWYHTVTKALHETNENRVAAHIQQMNYRDFLNTKYWRAVSQQTKYRANFRCQMCDAKGKLATHHRNYKVHGHEATRINELIALCDKCHTHFHAK